MVDLVKDVTDFYTLFGYPKQKKPCIPTSQADLINFRIKFLQEELDELKEAIKNEKIDDALDALVDIVYVALGTAWHFNLPFEKAWQVVHKANMAKLPGKSQRHYQDAIKPKGWKRPDIQSVISEYSELLDKHEHAEQLFLKGG